MTTSESGLYRTRDGQPIVRINLDLVDAERFLHEAAELGVTPLPDRTLALMEGRRSERDEDYTWSVLRFVVTAVAVALEAATNDFVDSIEEEE